LVCRRRWPAFIIFGLEGASCVDERRVLVNLPGVGANLDVQVLAGCVWEASAQELPPPPRTQAVCFWGNDGRPESPKFIMHSGASAFMSPEAEARYSNPGSAFTFLLGMRLRSRGSVRLATAGPAHRRRVRAAARDLR
jgi:choline dehydrogenase